MGCVRHGRRPAHGGPCVADDAVMPTCPKTRTAAGTDVVLLVVGAGAQDVEHELGRAVQDLVDRQPSAVGLDAWSANIHAVAEQPTVVLAWAVATWRPAVVLLVDEELPVDEQTTVVRATRATALAMLAALAADHRRSTGARASDVLPDVAALFAPERAEAAVVCARDKVPRVSVLVPVHDQEAYLDATVQSLLAQDYDDFEAILLDDGSTDSSLQVLRRYEGDPRVRVLTQSNVGGTGRLDLPFSRLVRAARGELLAWLGGDDVSLPHRLSAQVAAFDEDPGLDVCHGAADAIDPRGAVLGLVWGLGRGYDDFSLLRELCATNLVANPSVMMRRDAVERVGSFEEGLTCDYHFWLKSADRLRYRYLPRRLVGYRLHERSLSTSAEGFPKALREGARVRSAIVRRRTLEDLFPELAGSRDQQVWREAGIAFGNSLLSVDPDLALHAYALAEESGGSDEALAHNRAVAHLVKGDLGAARSCARAAGDHPASNLLLSALRSSREPSTVELRTPSTRLGPALHRARQSAATSARRWDGTPLARRRACVGIDVDRPDVTAAAFASWAMGTTQYDDVQWTIPLLSADVDEVLPLLGQGMDGLDLASAADVVVEHIDALALLPPEPERLTGMLRGPDDVTAMRKWSQRFGGSRQQAAG